MTKAELREDIKERYGTLLSRAQMEAYAGIGHGRLPVEKLTVFDMNPYCKRPRYDLDSFVNFLWACRKLGVIRGR